MSLQATLSEFSSSDKTWALCKSLFGVLPGAPPMHFYDDIGDVLKVLGRGKAQRQHFELAKRLADGEAAQDILWMSRLVDAGDGAYAVATGVRSAIKLFRKEAGALDNDEQQRNDAVLKAIALAYLGYKAFPGPLQKRAEMLWAIPAGRHLALYYATVEVALPFGDDLVVGGTRWMDQQIRKHGSGQLTRLTSMAKGRGLGEVKGMLGQMTGQLGAMVDQVVPFADKAADSIAEHLPGALGSATGVAASAADLMPVYRLLGARLAAEAVVMQALRG